MLSDEWLPRYRLLENFTAKWNGNGNAYDRGDYNSSFALRAVELKSNFWHFYVVVFCANGFRQIHISFANIIFPSQFATFANGSANPALGFSTPEWG